MRAKVRYENGKKPGLETERNLGKLINGKKPGIDSEKGKREKASMHLPSSLSKVSVVQW